MEFNNSVLIIVLFIPVICGQILKYSIPEEQEIGTKIGNIATDANITNTDITMEYIFLSQSNSLTSFFHLDKRDGSLYVGMRIDRESLSVCKFVTECLLSMDVICRNSGSFYKKIELQIKILDINDNSPTFSEGSVNLEISEGSLIGTSLPIHGAVDSDSGNFSVQNYTIIPQSTPFSVHYHKNVDGSSIARLILREKLDRENQSSYQFQVIAKDGGNPSNIGTLFVLLTVQDINDNQPEFSKNQYNITVDEDVKVNTTILTLAANDRDTGLNGDVIYSLSPLQNEKIFKLFQIDRKSGKLQVIESLIFEPGKEYRIIVIASDLAKQPLMSQTTVTVNIRDTHNNPPRIKVDLLSNSDKARILENAKQNAPIAHVTVDDPDTGYNGKISCSIHSEKFQLQNFNVLEYKVVVSKPLDREIQSEYTVTVICKDEGTPPLNASSSFSVLILDQNDNDPVFQKQTYMVQTQEDNNIGASLIRVSASDDDTGANSEITYRLKPSGFNFVIDPKSGLISAMFRLDREATSIIRLGVLAVDGGSPPRTGTTSVIIEISDINDNKPEFQNESFEFAIQENAPKSSSVGLLIATDKDENKKITFSLLSQYQGGIPFEVLPNGTIRTTEMLDRETISRYHFSVVATDDGVPPQRSSAKITVDVMDMNDNDPIFMFPSDNNSTVAISYQTLPHTVIAHLDSRDIDYGLNSTVTYVTKDRNHSNIFQLNSLSGRLVLVRNLFTSDIGKYQLSVIAQDKGTPPRTTERTLTIIVTSQLIQNQESVKVDDHKYFLIAIAISCVTVVIAVVIILTICLIKRADRLRQKLPDQQKTHQYPGYIVRNFPDDAMLHNDPTTDRHPSDQQLYPTHSNRGITPQISTKGITANLGQDEKIHHQLSSFTIQHALRTDNSFLPQFGYSAKKEGECNSERSGEVTPSDSGNGGSEGDLNSSMILSNSGSIDFDYLKNISPRKESFTTFNKPCLRKDDSLVTRDSLHHKVSFSEEHSHHQHGSISKGLFQRQDSLYSDFGSYCGHDDSTTTSGSYILEQDDFVDLEIGGGQCIV